ncbi:hypothetical protein SAMN04488063_1103 [Halopelagius inordinatus]|uniref:Uncharacterized protein n=1 Tax=Halopelagius inordinatus TaxID=553467 RepID=A0A1I2NGL6_9EURY|nr:hypothetical protein [Halopelagius inordinatus]SFG00441.1 hypothetical protein SAMN04488063_1103 [Halopelagius inordinatus]
MKSVLPPAEVSALQEQYQSLPTEKLADEANSAYRHLTEVTETLEAERKNGDHYGITICLEEVHRQEEKLELISRELRHRPDYDRETMLEF